VRFDPAANLRCWAVDVDVAGRTFAIPPLPAAPWLLAVLEGPLAVVPGLVDDTDGMLDEMLLDGTVHVAELEVAAHAAVEAAAGVRWWMAERLAASVAGTALGGELWLRGVDPDRVPFGAYLLAGWRWAATRLKESDLRRWESEVERPPTGVSAEEAYDAAESEALFMAAMAGGGG
jgi:hypothetical protein